MGRYTASTMQRVNRQRKNHPLEGGHHKVSQKTKKLRHAHKIHSYYIILRIGIMYPCYPSRNECTWRDPAHVSCRNRIVSFLPFASFSSTAFHVDHSINVLLINIPHQHVLRLGIVLTQVLDLRICIFHRGLVSA